MRINMGIVLAVLLALFAVTRYLVDGEHRGACATTFQLQMDANTDNRTGIALLAG
jgi:hypothetical protein